VPPEFWCALYLPSACICAALAYSEARHRAKVAAAIEEIEEETRARPGGARDRPVDVVSPSVIEVAARSTPCLLCDGCLRVNEHAAATIDGDRLRVADTTCSGCGSSWTLYFRIKSG